MKRTNIPIKQDVYRKNSFKDNSSNKNTYYNNNNREQQKSSFNYIQQAKLRVVQENLVSVSGLSTQFGNPDLLCDNEHFGKYGNVNKVIISTQGKHRAAFIQVYITFDSSADAAFTVKAMDGIKIDGRQISATFGTTKYCTYFLKQNECRNQKCFYLHGFDTKNELTDGVKNNLDFLDEKAEMIINKNLKMYIQRERKQIDMKQESEFPSYTETIQYLIDEGILKKETIEKLRNQVRNARNNEKQELKQEKQIKNIEFKAIQIPKSSTNIKCPDKINSKDEQNRSESNSIISNASSESSYKKPQKSMIEQSIKLQKNYGEQKNKKCNSLSTAPSPTKYQKNSYIEEQSIDKAIQKRIINEIMKNKLIYKSKMDFVTNVSQNSKEQNNKIINYVRKHLLNEL